MFVDTNSISLPRTTRIEHAALASSRVRQRGYFGDKGGGIKPFTLAFSNTVARDPLLSKLIRIENIIWIWSLMLLGHSRLIYRDKLRRFPVLHTTGREQILDKSDKTKFSKRERERDVASSLLQSFTFEITTDRISLSTSLVEQALHCRPLSILWKKVEMPARVIVDFTSISVLAVEKEIDDGIERWDTIV